MFSRLKLPVLALPTVASILLGISPIESVPESRISFSPIRLVVAALLTLFLLSACKSAEIVSFEHKESQLFYKTRDMDSPELSRFIFDGTLLVVDINEVAREDSVIWLGVYSKRLNKALQLDRVIILGTQWQEDRNSGDIIRTEKSTKNPGLFKNSIKLFEFKTELLEKARLDGEYLGIIVFFNIEGGAQQRAVFDLHRKVNKRTVFPTIGK